MHCGMFHSAGVLVHRQPVFNLLCGKGVSVLFRVGIAILVPGGVKEGIQGVCLPLGGFATGGSGGVKKFFVEAQGRFTRGAELGVGG